MKIRKFVMPQLACGLMAVIMTLSMTGCAANGPPVESSGVPEATTSVTLATLDTKGKDVEISPSETKAEKTSQPTQAAKETEPVDTTSAVKEQTQATEDMPTKESQSENPGSSEKETLPPETDPPETSPPETEPPHSHSYSASSTVAATCTCEGYTVYRCSCGSSYTDDYASATGHSWGEWTTTREPTSSAEGEKSRVCSSCGVAETAAIEKLPAEQIDTAALEAYGRQYGKDTYGFNPVVGTRAGYYPGWTVNIDSMEKGRSEVAECIDATADQLIAAGKPIVIVVDGVECPFLLDVEVVHEGGNQYCVWVYYG